MAIDVDRHEEDGTLATGDVAFIMLLLMWAGGAAILGREPRSVMTGDVSRKCPPPAGSSLEFKTDDVTDWELEKEGDDESVNGEGARVTI